MKRSAIALALALALCNGNASASGDRAAPTTLPSVGSNGSAWPEDATHVSSQRLNYEIQPLRGAETKRETYAQIAHSDTHLLIRVVAKDLEPARIVAQEAKHDGSIGGDDSISVSVVSQANSRRAYVFTVNAAGAKADYIASSGGDSAPQWNGLWEGSATRTSEGYVVEVAIPFATLGIDGDGETSTPISLNVERQVGRERAERLSLADINTNLPCVECQYIPVLLTARKSKEHAAPMLRLQPYLIASNSRRLSALTGQTLASSEESDAGLDATWNITSRDVVVATINPDFSQVELDSIQFQINKRFVRTLPERRVFFTNESGVFSTSLPLLYTRSLVDPRSGVQYVRRRDNYEFGSMWVEDAVTSFILPSEETSSTVSLGRSSTNFATRWNHRFGQAIRVGTLATHRGSDGYRNDLASIDGTWSISDKHQLDSQLAFSETCDTPGSPGPIARVCSTGSAGKLGHSYGGERWYTLADYTWFSDGFRADLGRVNQVGVSDVFATAGYQAPVAWPLSVQRFKASGSYARQESDESGLLYESAAVAISLDTKKTSLTTQFDTGRQAFEDRLFNVHGAQLQWQHRISGKFGYVASAALRKAVDYAELRTGSEHAFSGSVVYRPSPKFETRIGVSAVDFDSGGSDVYETVTISSRSEFHFDTRHHLMLLLNAGRAVVGSSTSDTATYQLTYQYKPSAFQYFIMGVSGAAQGGDTLAGLQPTSDFAFAKYVFNFEW